MYLGRLLFSSLISCVLLSKSSDSISHTVSYLVLTLKITMANGGDLERRPAQKTDAHTSSQELDPQSYSLSPSEGSGARSHYLDVSLVH